ncbi:MAG: hypothetical protein L6Q98_22380 [Anaerolineae bacterium]|nr:hypothetical protein [Anaerolineae bacterium]NUQ06622.1 hypothetical protein [Anaerolineae bacterium]
MNHRSTPAPETTRQPWRTPTLVNLSARRTESGSPNDVEDVIVTYSGSELFFGPITTAGGS